MLSCLLAFALYDVLFPFRMEVCWSPVIRDRRGEWLGAYLSCDDKWRIYPADLEDMSGMEEILLFKEDKYFYYHPGVNPVSILRAMIQNLVKGEIHSGASTITMQVARMLDRKPRTLLAKIKEMVRAIQLEIHYSKSEIMNAYMALLPYGGNIEGVTAASRMFFDTSPERLSLSSRVLLSVIPNNPNRLRPDRSNAGLIIERNKWLRRLKDAGIIHQEEYASAVSESMPTRKRSEENVAPHFTRMLRQQVDAKGALKTTLDKGMQIQVKQLADSHHRRWTMAGINQYAVMVVRNETGEVMTYLGSSDFKHISHQGEVNGLRAIRSPGSALKPLCYALAMDKGYITPATVLPDIPLDFGGYQPENFDKVFHGKVTAGFALSHSLNLPAVYLLEKNGLYDFTASLLSLGFGSIHRQQKNLGLSTILGGCGVRGEELIQLYVALSRGGQGISLKMSMQSRQDSMPTVFSRQTAWMISDILTQHARPDFPNGFQNANDIPRIAWKTGTSYGRRDAWSVGYNPDYTVLVWFGNFDGAPAPMLSGADVATPLLFDVFSLLEKRERKSAWFKKPEGLNTRKVCTETGLLPSPDCPYTYSAEYIAGVSSVQVCKHLKKVRVSLDETVSYCTHCLPEAGYKTLLMPDHSPEFLEWLISEKIPFDKAPPHLKSCSVVQGQDRLVIISPVQGKEYLLEQGNTDGISFRCLAPDDSEKLFWYLNGKFVGSALSGEQVFFTPATGRNSVSCTDDKGRSVKAEFSFGWY